MPRVPKLRRHSTGQAFVEVNRRRHYLGKYDDPTTTERYHRFLAELAATAGRIPVAWDELTVVELIDRFLVYARDFYGQARSGAGELAHYKCAIRPLVALYGRSRAVDFGPRAFKAVREHMISAPERIPSRVHVNQQMARIRRIFKWATAEELVPSSVFEALRTVEALRRNRSAARETEPVRPVSDLHVQAVKAHVSPQVWTLIQLQLLTAARPGEILSMRPGLIDRTADVWVYRPSTHKTQSRGHERQIFLGPIAQSILRPYLDRSEDAFCFSPREAEEERRARNSLSRKTPLSCGNAPGSSRKRRPKRRPGERYSTDSYRRAIHYACDRAEIPRWSPNQLRHAAATKLRADYGLEEAQVFLGHARADVTQVYAERDWSRARAIALEVG